MNFIDGFEVSRTKELNGDMIYGGEMSGDKLAQILGHGWSRKDIGGEIFLGAID